MDVKRKNGEYIGAFVPYGYEKSDDDKHKLVIDTYAAGIVKEIFRLKLHGMSQDAIATQLNNEGVLAPMEYKQSTGSGYQTGFLQNEKSVWSSVTVRRILENEISHTYYRCACVNISGMHIAFILFCICYWWTGSAVSRCCSPD